MGQDTAESSIDARVQDAVDAWLRWLTRWQPSTHRARTRLCRRCVGSPLVEAAGFDHDIPHTVKHALVMRLSTLIEAEVDSYTERNLPLLSRELRDSEARKQARPYRPNDGLAPEYQGLDIDPEPDPGQPFLFTMAELAENEALGIRLPEPPPLTDAAKAALRHEMSLADDHATRTGMSVCLALTDHRTRIQDAVERLVEPQVEALLRDLSRSLDAPL
ncbi:MAG: spermidine/putrescine ABC transporter substrate-binding protein [Microbacteriaceae bacterium]